MSEETVVFPSEQLCEKEQGWDSPSFPMFMGLLLLQGLKDPYVPRDA